MTKKQKLRLQTDKIWKNACFLKYGKRCEICEETYLATPHHFYYRRSEPYLRYSISNGVILCGKCHARLHFKDPKIVEEKIIEKRGTKWLNKLKKERDGKPKYFTFDEKWLNKQIECLNK